LLTVHEVIILLLGPKFCAQLLRFSILAIVGTF